MTTEHNIINGDCVSELKKILTNSVEMVLTDPPFNIGKKYNSYKDNRTKNKYLIWCFAWLDECVRVMKDGAALYLINYPENNAYLMRFLDERLTFKRWLTWHYPTNTGMSPTNFTRSQHSILFYVKGEKSRVFNKEDIAVPYLNPKDKRIMKLMAEGSKGKVPFDVFATDGIQHTPDLIEEPWDIFEFNIVKNVCKDKTDHPCQIPVPLLEIFIRASSRPGETILDPFAGSFSTAAACQRLGRNTINIELDAKYCEIGKKRLGLTSVIEPV